MFVAGILYTISSDMIHQSRDIKNEVMTHLSRVELTCRAAALSYQQTQSWGRVLRCPKKHRQQQLLHSHVMFFFYDYCSTVWPKLLPLLLLPGRGGCSCISAHRDKALSLRAKMGSPKKPSTTWWGEQCGSDESGGMILEKTDSDKINVKRRKKLSRIRFYWVDVQTKSQF